MQRILILLIFTLLCGVTTAQGQIVDDFSDGNFNLNPAWTGDVTEFMVNTASELQLSAAAAGNSLLAVQGNIPDSAVWNLRFKMIFSPSTQNLLRIYLLADQQDLSQANGYFLEIGETGSQDALRFFRQEAGVKTLIATGQAALPPKILVASPPLKFLLTIFFFTEPKIAVASTLSESSLLKSLEAV